MRLKLTVEYDGTGFRGWAAQPELRTVEGELRAAWSKVFAAFDNVAVAGRTDTGVHALGNVVSVDVDGGPPVHRAAEALNAVLPDDVVDERRLADAAVLLVGEHDFRAFTPTETQHEAFKRTVLRAEWHRRGDALEFEITAESFLRHMVRTLVGTMIELPPERIADLVKGRPRSEAGSTAPPWGLYLTSVAYD